MQKGEPMRLIDANDVKRHGDYYLPDVRKAISNILSHTKTVEDAVVIVRCKDCLMHGVCRFEQGLGLNGYCSQAERREE